MGERMKVLVTGGAGCPSPHDSVSAEARCRGITCTLIGAWIPHIPTRKKRCNTST